MYKKYKCTETGNLYEIWAMPNGIYSICELFGDYDEYIYEFIPHNLVLVN